jgi:hypothetical protein
MVSGVVSLPCGRGVLRLQVPVPVSAGMVAVLGDEELFFAERTLGAVTGVKHLIKMRMLCTWRVEAYDPDLAANL